MELRYKGLASKDWEKDSRAPRGEMGIDIASVNSHELSLAVDVFTFIVANYDDSHI